MIRELIELAAVLGCTLFTGAGFTESGVLSASWHRFSSSWRRLAEPQAGTRPSFAKNRIFFARARPLWQVGSRLRSLGDRYR
jgi:hypothetical protein